MVKIKMQKEKCVISVIKYSELAREMKRLLNMKVTAIPIVVEVLRKVANGLKKRGRIIDIRERMETI